MALNKDFLIELLKLSFYNDNILDTMDKHLEYNYLPTEPYKALFKRIITHYKANSKRSSIGIIAQSFSGGGASDREIKLNEDVLELIDKIKEIPTPQESDILNELEIYIKDSMSVEFGNKYTDLYNKGERDEARKLLASTADTLVNFSLKKDTNYFQPIFGGFVDRQIDRKLNNNDKKIYTPFGIDELDWKTNGGLPETDMALFIAQSGKGKTKLGRHIGITNARLGNDVLHIQLEGSKAEAEDGYDATWTAENIYHIEHGLIDETVFENLQKISEEIIDRGSDVFLVAFEQFDSVTCVDIRNVVLEFWKKRGRFPALIIIDYLELAEPGDGKIYSTGVEGEKARRTAIARKFKNICTEFKTRIISFTQASNVAPTLLDTPTFCMTRNDISANKNLIDAFTYVWSLNQTSDEYREGMMRIFNDKSRKSTRSNYIAQIYTAFQYDKFYDRLRTLREVHNQNY